MRIAIFENIMTPGGHEVEFDRILVEEFRALGFVFPEPSGNFLFVRHPGKHAAEIFAALKERGIYVRYFPKPRIDEYLRVTVGTDEQMDTLFAALREILG